uniref:Uncharacterized protein n=1 Tax=Chenopodium quinoa TaxID=63459 RepID=A0A803MI51_CHEQI
ISRKGVEPPATFKVPANVNVDDQLKDFKNHVNQVSFQVDKLEQKINEIEQFYSNNSKKQIIDSRNNLSRDYKDKGRHVTTRLNHSDSKAKRMQDLIRQFGVILNQITQKKDVCSSLDSVDVNDLGLHDSSESVIGKPRDFNSIKKRMEDKGDNGYKHVREIYADVRWILKNAMKCNDERSDAHVTAKTLLAKFEGKWLVLLPKIMQEEERTDEEAGLKQTYHAQMAKDLYKVDKRLNELRELMLQRCRRMSTMQKRELGRALTKLSADDLTKALEILAQGNPSFQVTEEEVDLDIDAQSESTLRRLKYFVVERLKAKAEDEAKQLTNIGGDKNERGNGKTLVNKSKALKSDLKRKAENKDAPAKKKTRKVGSIFL